MSIKSEFKQKNAVTYNVYFRFEKRNKFIVQYIICINRKLLCSAK